MVNPAERVPPHDRPAEICVLGSMILAPETIDEAQATLSAADFYHPPHGLIFKALLSLSSGATPIDLVVLRNRLEADGTLAQVGGVEYLVELADGVPDASNIAHYAKIVRDMAIQRRLITHANALLAGAYNPVVSAADLLQTAEAGLYEISHGRTDLALVTAGDAATRVVDATSDYKDEETSPGIQTGLYALDDASGGMHPGELIVVAADTGMGKTTLADTITLNVADLGGKVFVVSVEMSDTERAQRYLMQRAKVAGFKFRKPERIEPEDWTKLIMAQDALERMGVRIHWGKATTAQILSQARRAASQMGGLDLVVVDYLQLLTPAPEQGRNRAERISAMAWSLKMELAMGLQVPVLLLSQLTRSSLKEKEPPSKHDLKESGDIENHANVIWLIHEIGDHVVLCQDKHRSMPRTFWDSERGAPCIYLDWDRPTTRFTRAYYAA